MTYLFGTDEGKCVTGKEMRWGTFKEVFKENRGTARVPYTDIRERRTCEGARGIGESGAFGTNRFLST